MGDYSKADLALAPVDLTNDDDFEVRKFTAATTHSTDALPAKWFGAGGYKGGAYVTLISTVDVHVAFSKRSGAEVDRTVSKTDAGASAKVGWLVKANTPEPFWLPKLSHGETWYFSRESGSAGEVYLRLSSGE